MTTPMRVIAYVRVSTENQADKGHSLEAQRDQIESYVKTYGYVLVDVVVDAGVSASSLDRPGLRTALSALDEGRADALLVTKLDRLTRSVRDLGTLVERYFIQRFHLMSVGEHVDTSSAGGRLVLNVLMSVAQWEREAAAERTVQVMKHLKTQGKFTGGWPQYGYYADEEGTLREEPEEQAIILRAKALREEGLSLRGIAAQLPANRNGRTFDPKQIERML